MMGLLNYSFVSGCSIPITDEKRYERDVLGDLKHGLDLIFALKKDLDKLHPIASETLIRLMSH